MSLSEHGNSILTNNEVTNISKHGFWILINSNEYFVPFNEYPEFKKATIDQIINFEMLSPIQLHWKSIDCDIELSALEKPQHFPLKYK
jgi:hypothetical protein